MIPTYYTYEQIANDYTLWTEYIDIDCHMSRDTFESTPVSELIELMTDICGPEIDADLE